MSTRRVLPADVYDALELSAIAYGGVGGYWLSYPGDNDTPYCIYGHSAFVTDSNDAFENSVARALDKVLDEVGRLGPSVNNDAVEAINQRKGESTRDRVSWKEYTRELNIVRGR